MDRNERRDMYDGLDDGLTKAMEVAITPLIFGGAGFLLDRWLGIVPVLTIALSIFALCGVFVNMWYRYDAEMKRHEEERRAWADRS